jgi:hypothetical protein
MVLEPGAFTRARMTSRPFGRFKNRQYRPGRHPGQNSPRPGQIPPKPLHHNVDLRLPRSGRLIGAATDGCDPARRDLITNAVGGHR